MRPRPIAKARVSAMKRVGSTTPGEIARQRMHVASESHPTPKNQKRGPIRRRRTE